MLSFFHAFSCSFLDMRATLARGDNAIMQNYCDKVLLVASEFSDHVSLKTPVPLQLYVTLAREGKPNKASHFQFLIPSLHALRCTMLLEQCQGLFCETSRERPQLLLGGNGVSTHHIPS